MQLSAGNLWLTALAGGDEDKNSLTLAVQIGRRLLRPSASSASPTAAPPTTTPRATATSSATTLPAAGRRSLKEEVWASEYLSLEEARASIGRYLWEYNHDRPPEASGPQLRGPDPRGKRLQGL